MSLFDKDELHSFLVETKESHRHLDEEEAQKLSRREFLDWLDVFSTGIKDQLQATEALDPATREERVTACLDDFDKFRRTYFGHYYTIEGKSKLQEDLESIFHRIRDKKGTKEQGESFARGAPRGFGKSTDVSLSFVIYVIVYELKHFPLIFSDAIELTETLTEAIKAELEHNEALKADFPHVAGAGRVWKVGEIITRNNIKLKGFGSGKRVRGIKHGTYRPDLVIIDDLENDENVRSRTQRDKTEEWVDAAVENLGSVEGLIDIIYIGTILHRDSVLARKLKLAYWNPKIYRAVERYPMHMDLWDEYAVIFRNQGLEAAHQFYIDRKTKMDEGAVLLWDKVSLELLMQKRAKNKKAFEKEQQNRPNAEDQRFDSSKFKVVSRTQCPRFDYVIAYTDFKGSSEKASKKLGDYTTVIAGGVSKAEHKLYVFYTYRERVKGKKAVEMLVKTQKKHEFDIIGGETNGGFFLYKEWYKEKCQEQGIDEGELKFKHMSDSKESRIETLEYPIDEEDIVFVDEHTELFNELDDFPEADFDDLSDNLAGLWRISKLAKKQSKKRTRYKKSSKSNRQRRR